MHTNIDEVASVTVIPTRHKRHRVGLLAFALLAAAIGVSLGWTGTARADFSGGGDIIIDGAPGFIANAGYDTTSPGDIIVADEGTAGIFGDAALPLAGGDLHPLRADLAIIGNEVGSIGAVTLEDFMYLAGSTDPTGGNWIIDEDLAVGNNGQGFLDLLNSARVYVEDDVWIGGSPGTGVLVTATGEGYGLVTINGTGTRLVTGHPQDNTIEEFYIGYNGLADVEVSGRGSIETGGRATIGEENFADGRVMLTDRGTRWTIEYTLTIGNGQSGATTAHGYLEINNQAQVLVGTGIDINSRGQVRLGGGRLELLEPTTYSIVNGGVISGSGIIEGQMTITGSGQLRNAAGVANAREYMQITERVTNAGLIESQGGEMEFEDTVTNLAGAVIVARDAIMRFRGSEVSGSSDLVNDGDLILGGNTTIYGTISGGGTITTIGPGTTSDEIVISGDVTFDPTPLLAASSGGGLVAPDTGFALTIAESDPLTIVGDLNLAGIAALAIDYVGDDPIDEGYVLQVMSVTGAITGTFANSELIANGRTWDINILGNDVLVTAGALIDNRGGDFDGDGDVDGNDFLAWQRGLGDASNLSDFESNYGTTVGALATTAAVPEPAGATLLLLAVLGCSMRRAR